MRNNIVFFLVTFLITSFIIFSWFSTKTIISNNSEENLDFFNFTRTANNHATSWYPSGTGNINVFGFVRYPFLKFLSFFQQIGFEPFLIQAFSFWIIMYLGVIFMYILLNKGFLLSKLESIIGSYFYLFNIYTMTQVWKRNIYQGMFPWAYLPLFIFLWMKWLNEGKFYWLIIFVASISVFSHAFAHPGYFFVYIVTGGVFTLIKLKQNWKNRSVNFKLLLKILAAIFLGTLFNIWWIYPVIRNLTAGGSTIDIINSQWKASFDSLAGVSKYFGTFDILLLRQKHYFGKDSPLSTEWFFFYDNFLTILISLIGFLIVIYGVIKSKIKSYFKYLFSLFLIGWFVSKGTNFPLGGIFYSWLFSHFSVTAALRNPYEKFGLVWVLPYSTFFGLGLSYLAMRVKLKSRYLFIAFMMTLFCGILVYPMWNGDIFPLKHRLTIPAYYLETNEYLNSALSKRSFHIPFSTQTELIKYSWGYLGQDPSENLFDSQNVSREQLPVFVNYHQLIPKYLSKDYLPRLLGLLGVDNIILHSDLIYPKLDLNLVNIEKWKEIKRNKEFGQLTIFSLDSNIIKPEIYTTNSLVKFDSLEQALNKISDGEFDIIKNIFVTEDTSFNSRLEDSPINIEFQKISNNRYQVQVKKAKDPFILVLNQTFNGFWQAKINSQIKTEHFLVNGFANGWLIEKIGDYQVDIVLKIWPWD